MKALGILISGFYMLLVPFSATAQTPPPVPPSKPLSLENYQTRLHEETEQKQALEQKLKNVENEMNATKDKMVAIGKNVRANERDLQQIETRVEALEKEKSGLEEKLQEQRSAIARLILALERIRRVPPQALIIKPDAPLKTAQTAMLLSDIIPSIHAKAQDLREDLKRQEQIGVELQEQRSDAMARTEALRREYSALSKLSEERVALYQQTQKDYRAQEMEVQRVSQGAKNLKDLVKKLEQQRRAQDERRAQQEKERTRQASARNPESQPNVVSKPREIMPKSGISQLPVSGVIRTRYNDIDRFGAKSQGVRIEGRENGLVVAPMAGIVRFAGPFKGYDNMVIIEHDGGYHSLVAGMETVSVTVGQNVKSGEPLGALKSTTNQGKPTVYYELRLNGNAIDPAKKLTDLG